jgi:RimJ/RimL family protein N-acetyltransferase
VRSVPRTRALTIDELPGRLVRLRRFAPDEAEAAWRGLALLDEAAHPRTRPDEWLDGVPDRFRKVIARSGRLFRGQLDLAVERRRRLIGQVQARTAPAQTLPPGVFEVGVAIYRQRDRGHGYGRDALDPLTRWLFDVAGARRVQATTEAGNAAMRAVLERVGLQLEGTLRAYGAARDGTPLDGALYAMLDRDRVSAPL